MPVRLIFDSGQAYAGRAYTDAMIAARSHAVPVEIARRGMRWTSGDGVTLDVLAPSLPFLVDTGDDVNENSIVVMPKYRDFRELLMGDADESSEARLLADGSDVRADALKAASRQRLRLGVIVRPGYAVISVGRHNTFGPPHPGRSERGIETVLEFLELMIAAPLW